MTATWTRSVAATEWVAAAAVFGALSMVLLFGVGFAVVSDCTSEPGCSTRLCNDWCHATFYRHWSVAVGALAAVTVVSVPVLRLMAWVPIALAAIGAAAVLIALR